MSFLLCDFCFALSGRRLYDGTWGKVRATAEMRRGEEQRNRDREKADVAIASCLAATQGTGTTAASSTTTASAQQTLFSQDANFLYICDV